MHSQNEQASRLYQTAVPNNVCFFNQYYMADTMPILPWHAHDLYCFLVSKLFILFTLFISQSVKKKCEVYMHFDSNSFKSDLQ